jgi:TonB family protein
MILLLDWAWKATLLLLAAWMAAACLCSQTAALRHRVWALALAGLVVAPALSFLVPALHLRVAPAVFRAVASAPPAIPGVAIVVEAAHVNRTPWIVMIWAAGFGIVMLRLVAGTIWIRCRTRPLIDQGCRHLANGLAESFGVRRNVRLLAGKRNAMPVTWGLLRPCILLPADAADWSEERRRIVLSHELAHVGRGDWGWQICAEVSKALYWFNPLVWLAARRLRQESELACDDVVLNSGIQAADYAGELLNLSATLKNSGWLCSPALAMARTSNLERRFTSMLNPSLNRRRFSRPAQLVTALAALSALIPLVALRAPAQAQAGKLSGTVYDPDGANIPFASLTLINEQTHVKEPARADAVGNYSFVGVSAGAYELRVSQPGFALYSKPEIVLTAGQSTTLNVKLALGSITETIQVVGSGPSNANATRAAQPQRIRVGGNVQATKLVRQVKPAYPPQALAAGIEGSVILNAVIGKDGKLSSIRVLKSMGPEMDEAAMSAVSQWLYEPTLLNGEPVEVLTDITVTFKLS